MPLPLLFIVVSGATGAFGIGKSVKAFIDKREAQKTNNQANEILRNAQRKLNKYKKECASDLTALGMTKANILRTTISDFINTYSTLKNIIFNQKQIPNESEKLRTIDSKDFYDLKALGEFASNIMKGAAEGSIGGILTALGAYSAVGTWGTASTGTAIATLNGIAASNATLAFLGGGPLAAGGLGIGGGFMVLGALVGGPALAIMGILTGNQASKAKEEAYSNLATANYAAEKLNAATDSCIFISQRCKEFIDCLNKLDSYLRPLIFIIDKAIEERGNFQNFTPEQKQAAAAAGALAKAIKAILDVAILNEDGSLTSESKNVLANNNPDKIISQTDINRNIYGAYSSKMNREMNIKQIISNSKYHVEKRDSLYGLTEEEYADINIDLFTELVNYSYGLECTKTDIETFVLESHTGKIKLIELEWSISKFIQICQISLIIEECMIDRFKNLSTDNIDWDKLMMTINKIYKTKIDKKAVIADFNLNIENIIGRIYHKIRAVDYEKIAIFTASDFKCLMHKVKETENFLYQ